MSPELINAIKERLQAAQPKEEIETAVLAMGHTKEVFQAAFTLALHDMNTIPAATLPEVIPLFIAGADFVKKRLDLLVLLSIPLILETLASKWFGYNQETDLFPSWPLSGIFVLLGIVYMCTLAMALFVVTRKAGEEASLAAALAWLPRNILKLVFVYVLSGLVILGGLIFFIIPGIVVAIAITFAQYIYVVEGKSGMDALLRSRALVTGRFFTVASKVIAFVLLTFVPIIVLSIFFAIVGFFAGEGKVVALIAELSGQVFSAGVGMISLYTMYHLYEALLRTVSHEVSPKAGRVRYWAMASIIAIAVVAISLAMYFFEEKMSWLEEEAVVPLKELETIEDGAFPSGFAQFKETALKHANEYNGSFSGVCAALKPLVEAEGEVTCNDSETTWALEVVDTFGGRYCADTATPGKEIHTALGDKTECIAVGE